MSETRNPIRTARRRSGEVLQRVLSAACLPIGRMAVIVGPRAGPARTETPPSNTAGRCRALAAPHWPGVEITGARLVPAAPAGTVPYGPITKFKIPSALPEHCRIEGVFYNGASDAWFSLYDTLDYVQRNKAANPDFDSSRLYSVPSMGHCEGGGLERFDLLTALVDWVEKGAAPGGIVATDWTHRAGTRPLCPWPQYGRYKGTGDPKDAANFECRSD